jgi:hypothetical protein
MLVADEALGGGQAGPRIGRHYDDRIVPKMHGG